MTDAKVLRGPWTGRPVVNDPRLHPSYNGGEQETTPLSSDLTDAFQRIAGALYVDLRGVHGEEMTRCPVPAAPGEGPPNAVVVDGEIIPTNPSPARITLALDMCCLYGPVVDEALGVLTADADVVDKWETGEIIPTYEQICRLATLTGMFADWFYLPLDRVATAFICPPEPSTNKEVASSPQPTLW